MKAWQIAAGLAVSGFLVATATAAPMSGVGQTDTASAVEQAKGKAKAKAKGPGHCGVMMYWDRKKRACASKG